jgi:hypothetical protein
MTSLSFVIDDADAARGIDGDHPLADAVERSFAFLQKARNLVEFESERPALQNRREAERCERANGKNRAHPDQVGRKLAEKLARHRTLFDANRDLADHKARHVVQRDASVGRGPG